MIDEPKGRHYPTLPPMLDGEDHARYSNRLIGAAGPEAYPYDHVRNRQCALGWHDECSERGPVGNPTRRCQCPCHQEAPGIDPWPTDADMAMICGGPTPLDQELTGGCAHTLGRHHYGDGLAPCEVPGCGCRHFRG